jgi:hypothetical protein
MLAMFYCDCKRRSVTIEDCVRCYEYLRGECSPTTEIEFQTVKKYVKKTKPK